MKIWYQGYTNANIDPKWKSYGSDLSSYVVKIARPDTQVDLHYVGKMSPKMPESDYIQFLHIPQAIENAFQAQREGYDAFCLGGTLELYHVVLRDVLEIPVAFLTESSLYNACLLARKFSIIAPNMLMLRILMDLVEFQKLGERSVPSEPLGQPMFDLLETMSKNPQVIIESFSERARIAIKNGAGALIPGYGPLSLFLSLRGIRDIDGVPIVDLIANVIKTAEMLADLAKMGIKRNRKGFYTYASKEDLMEARKLYGVE